MSKTNGYIFYTDSSCDMPVRETEQLGIRRIPLYFTFDGEDGEYTDCDMSIDSFYGRMREGAVVKTSAVSPSIFESEFEKALDEGYDVIYTGLSGALSSTYNSARIAASELNERYPEHHVFVIDSLSASVGIAMLLRLGCEKKAAGATSEETAEYMEYIRHKICHWFAVDDLEYLRRGGRISSTAAVLGGVLGIRPILHVNGNGRPAYVSKVRGKKAVIGALADRYAAFADDVGGCVYVAHADDPEDAERLKDELVSRFSANVGGIFDVGSVIGAHVGPGTVALFFVGRERGEA